MNLPSGDHTGAVSWVVPAVSGVASPPPTGTAKRQPRKLKAIVPPSGAIAGYRSQRGFISGPRDESSAETRQTVRIKKDAIRIARRVASRSTRKTLESREPRHFQNSRREQAKEFAGFNQSKKMCISPLKSPGKDFAENLQTIDKLFRRWT